MRKQNLITAIDLGRHVGIASLTVGGKIVVESVTLPRSKPERFTAWLELCDSICVDAEQVAYEVVHAHKGTLAAHDYGYYQGALIARCHQFGVPLVAVTVSQARKTIGVRTKQEAHEWAKKQLGLNRITTDVADALAVLCHVADRKAFSDASNLTQPPSNFS